MLPLHRTLTLGYLAQHPTRTALVVISIALGVATLVATQALNRGLATSAEKSVNPLSRFADLLVTNSQAGVPSDLARDIREAHLEGIADARACIMTRVAIADLDNRSAWFLGFDVGALDKEGGAAPRSEASFRKALKEEWGLTIDLTFTDKWALAMEIARGHAVVLVDRKLAEDIDARRKREKEEKLATSEGAGEVKDAQHFTIRISGQKPTATILGTVTSDGGKLELSDNLVITDVRTASALTYPNDPGMVSQINVVLTKGADKEEVRRRLASWVQEHGNAGQVQTVEASRALVADVTAGLELGFAIGGAGALVVGLFLVYNALSVSVAERRHDIGILRSVGATRGQIARLFVLEAAGLGLLGSALGLPLGIGLAWVAVKPLSRVVSEVLVPLDSARIDASPVVMALALLAGVVVAVLAALVPALQAAGEEPAEAVRRVPRHNTLLFFVLQLGATALLLIVGATFVHFRADLPRRVGVFAGIIGLLLGALVSTPLLASLVGRIVQPLFRYFLGLEGRLAADNLVRSPGRTGLVIGALAATAGLMVQTAGFLRSSEDAIFKWVDEKIAADLFVTSGAAVTSGGYALGMKEEIADDLRAMPEVAAALAVRFYQLDYGDHIVFLIALDTHAFDQGAGDRALARNLGRFEDFGKPDTCLVSQNFATLHHVAPGGTIEIRGRGSDLHQLKVVGLVEDYSWNRGTILVPREWFRDAFADRQINVVDLYLKKGADPNAVQDKILARWEKGEALFVLTRPEVYKEVRASLKGIYSMAYAQQMVVGLVALLGVVSALFISVLQRRRELGLLRAVGASRSQVLRSVLAEAVLMGIIGAAVGFGIGLLLEWYVLDIMLLDEAGFIFPMKVPWLEAGVVTGAAVVLATLAGLWPAYHATRLRIPDAIAYE